MTTDMNPENISRRQALTRAGTATAALAVTAPTLRSAPQPEATTAIKGNSSATFRYCLNTATIRGQKVGIAREVELAAQAGYHAIEPWIGSIEDYVKGGGSLKDLRRRIEDSGLTVESAIGFPQWIVDDDAQRAKGLERAKLDMDLVAQIGGKRVAAPPAGATDKPGLDLLKAAERYRALLELGDQMGVVPQVELWGFSQNLHRVGEVLFVASESRHPKACVVLDVYHVYKGGSGFDCLHLLGRDAMHVFHMNDYPAEPPRETINDSHRVYPGDGIAPLDQALRTINVNGGTKFLSLELFSKAYWAQDPLKVCQDGLAKMKAAVQKAVG